MNTAPLFQPFHSDKLKLDNRVVMAPMTRGFSPGNVPGDDVAEYYRRRAAGGVGLIVTEGTGIDHPASISGASIPVFHGEEALAGWKKVVDAVHAEGGKIAPQLWHVGMARKVGDEPNVQAQPVGPSGLNLKGEKVGEPLTESEIADLIQAYAQAASDAKKLGFDAIELHGAHGYLIDQFLWKGTNQRTDRYGGDLTGRATFAVEVVRACRAAVGEDYPIIFRYSQWKMYDYTARLAQTPEELEQLLGLLVDAGVDIFHASTRRFWEPEFEGSELNLAGWTQKLTGKPTISVGSVGLQAEFTPGASQVEETDPTAHLDELIHKLEHNEFDLIAIGRALLSDPEWPNKIRDQRSNDIQMFSREALETLV
ncbi:NADH:flavin oxidoreductase [Paenibacillus hunanensis]|uniref:NADH:flavin oxidoreductase n=1 Tax=Paenibacillus hunanensis TaxID=539262 RepID=UPI002A6B8F32|nr:NADH:flavin oxidoreductase [Paenibacillus hunanensis]WPP39667.1 NADH:flavin oxidoreductase [Paenibacillus hunanensis]